MTNQEINERVAKLCGWERKPFVYGTMDENDEPIQQEALAWYKDGHGFRCFQKNYAESLDACREFETAITGDDRSLYMDHIYLIVIQSNNNAVMGFENQWSMFNASPLQRCKAFLRMKGQWE